MDNIQYTITINQYAVLANGFDLDIVDMAIFDFISRFAHVDRCIKLSDESGRWFWVSHAMVMKHLPILGIRSEQGIANHVKKLICAGLLIRHPDCERLHRTFYRFGPAYESLVFANPQKIEKAPKNFGATPNETLGITPNETLGYNNKEIDDNKEDNIKEKTRRRTSENLCLFADSKFENYDAFAAEFTAPEFADIDILYYYHAVADWSASKGAKKRDWIATARNFIRADMQRKTLHKVNSGGLSPDALKYLSEMSW